MFTEQEIALRKRVNKLAKADASDEDRQYYRRYDSENRSL
jgi:hypothetical protein